MLCEKNQCTGCAACAAVCPVRAIEMKQDKDGFYFPAVSEGCIHCGLCEKTCPVLAPKKRPDAVYPQAFVMKHKDAATLHKSASGGMFSLLAAWAFAQGGCIYGAVWDENFHVQLRRADTMAAAAPMRGSKYVYSHAQQVYGDVKKQLAAGRTVVFTGVPCQIAGLYGFLGKEYPNLYTAEIVCHGAGSEKVFDSYLELIQQKSDKRLAALDQTSKKRPWNKLIRRYVCQTWEDGTESCCDFLQDSYLSFYMKNVCFNQACYQCQNAALPRVADITMGDFMGYNVEHHHNTPGKGGVSAIWANTQKGNTLLQKLQGQQNAAWEPCTLEECMNFNHTLWKPSSQSPVRSVFFEKYHTIGYARLADEWFDKNTKYKAVCGIKGVLLKVFGAHLIACGVYAANKRKGLSAEIEKSLSEMQKSSRVQGR